MGDDMLMDDINYLKIKGTSLSHLYHKNKIIWEELYQPTDSDFAWEEDIWRYIGNKKKLKLPQHINGKLLSDYTGMFSPGYKGTFPVTKIVADKGILRDATYMFSEAEGVDHLDLSGLDTSETSTMQGMFASSKLKTVDLSNFNTSRVKDMSYMFEESAFEYLDLSNFDTSQVRDFSAMFNGSAVRHLNLSNFVFKDDYVDTGSMFYECLFLETLDLTSLTLSALSSSYPDNMFYETGKEVKEVTCYVQSQEVAKRLNEKYSLDNFKFVVKG